MSTPTAKDLLAQADRLMRQRLPEELPVLTDLVIEEIEIPSLTDRMDEVIPTHAQRPTAAPSQAAAAPARVASFAAPSPATPMPAPRVAADAAPPPATQPGPAALTPAAVAPSAPSVSSASARDVLGMRPRMTHDDAVPIGLPPDTVTAVTNVREQFNAQLLAKLDELKHSVYSQVMQQLELYAAGSMKTHLRTMLEPALVTIAHDIADQVAEDTSVQVRDVVSKAVDSEIARLREQLAAKRHR